MLAHSASWHPDRALPFLGLHRRAGLSHVPGRAFGPAHSWRHLHPEPCGGNGHSLTHSLCRL